MSPANESCACTIERGDLECQASVLVSGAATAGTIEPVEVGASEYAGYAGLPTKHTVSVTGRGKGILAQAFDKVGGVAGVVAG